MEYPALFRPAPEGGFVITFPDFDWGITQGDSESDALKMAADAIHTILQEHIRNSEPIPAPSKPRGRNYRLVRLPALDAAKVTLYSVFQSAGISKSEFARRLGIPKTTVDRLFDLDNHTRLDQMEAAFSALGKRLDLQVSEAA
jgi:antitoxin HicB